MKRYQQHQWSEEERAERLHLQRLASSSAGRRRGGGGVYRGSASLSQKESSHCRGSTVGAVRNSSAGRVESVDARNLGQRPGQLCSPTGSWERRRQ